MIFRSHRLHELLDSVNPDVLEVSDKLTLLAAARWARERGIDARSSRMSGLTPSCVDGCQSSCPFIERPTPGTRSCPKSSTR